MTNGWNQVEIKTEKKKKKKKKTQKKYSYLAYNFCSSLSFSL